jgi:hypothetical protein
MLAGRAQLSRDIRRETDRADDHECVAAEASPDPVDAVVRSDGARELELDENRRNLGG